ncbi:gluconokinase [Acidobacterium sp. S8]|uniref:gluconokinase n=1 Tax=Acidobacterium sp. S8 TaxID=1641854 RepID=UPI00131E768F|nr:gluconokinase [Acidobacterium sp. S8]
MILIVMGVSGSGKTTLARALAKATGWQFAEGDDYHSTANKAKMHAGIPLTDEDRAPWLATLHDLMAGWHQKSESGILTCSALKQTYRETLVADLPDDAYRFVLTEAPKKVISERMQARHDHFMPAALLDSQLATLEPPANALHVSAQDPPEVSVQKVLAAIGITPSPQTN